MPVARSTPIAAALGLALSLTIACGDESRGAPNASPSAAPASGRRVDAAEAGTLTGTVRFRGAKPAPEVLKVQNDPKCIQILGASIPSDAVQIDAAGGVANAFVYVKHDFDGYTFDTPRASVVFDQRGCRYSPRIFGVRVGQAIDIVNSDPTLHNVHAQSTVNAEFNRTQPQQDSHMTQIFTAPEVMVRLTCDVHPWMVGWVGVVAHPFFAVTSADGTFTMPGIPAGTYDVAVWHEKLGEVTASVTITAGASATTTLTLGKQAP